MSWAARDEILVVEEGLQVEQIEDAVDTAQDAVEPKDAFHDIVLALHPGVSLGQVDGVAVGRHHAGDQVVGNGQVIG